MRTLTQPAVRLPVRHHHPVTTAALVTLFWAIAAALTAFAHVVIDGRSPLAAGAVTIVVIVVTAWAYVRSMHDVGMTHALGTGSAWLLLSIASELALTTRLHHGWFSLIGSPDQPFLRNVMLFVWVFAPALFARGDAP